MIIDARSIPANETIETDVCIVGAGTAGITLARAFIGQPFRVCLLESGGLEPDQETQSLYQGENAGLPYYPLDTARARYLGGSSNRWHIELGGDRLGVRLRPLDPIDFAGRDWVPYSGWPFDKTHLDPFYDRAQAVCRIEPVTYDVKAWEDPEKRPRLPFVGNRMETVIFKFGTRDLFTKEYCSQVKSAENITTYLHANAVEVETDEAARVVNRLQVACLQGNRFSVSARLFILALGGIETPRLLLLSRQRQSTGLGNQHDLVGRFFMEHLHFWSGIYLPPRPDFFRSTALYNTIHTVQQVPIIGKLALTEPVLRREKLLSQNVQLIPSLMSNTFLYPPLPSQDPVSVVRNAYRRVRRVTGRLLNRQGIRVFQLANMTEQIPNPNSRVTLSHERDRLGQNRVRLDWQITPLDIRSAIRTQEIMGEELQRAGLGRLYIQLRDETPPPGLHGGYHHMGTTRMHNDPKQGVVDADSRVHGTANLYVAGPSVFPTGGYANPVLTIVALALRLADHVKMRMKEGA